VVAFSFPSDIYQKLDGIDLKLLNEFAFLSRLQRKRTGSAYCCPGREYLAGKLGCDVGTISRHTSKLVGLGILDKRQRRPVRGIWQTCLYRLRSYKAWMLGQIAGLTRKIGNSHGVRQDAQKHSLRGKKETPRASFSASKPPDPPKSTRAEEVLRWCKEKGWLQATD
jgi:hypothetical protein